MPALDINSSCHARKDWLLSPEKSGSVSKALFNLKQKVEAGTTVAIETGVGAGGLPGVPPARRCGLSGVLPALLPHVDPLGVVPRCGPRCAVPDPRGGDYPPGVGPLLVAAASGKGVEVQRRLSVVMGFFEGSAALGAG